MRTYRVSACLLACLLVLPRAQAQKPTDPEFSKFHPVHAPVPAKLLLQQGDRLAICGDSITEQKMYSRLVEDYLTMCAPELGVSVRQYGWNGEWAGGFLARMTNDCLRFQPTIATTCYGMNDHQYRPYEERIGRTYREKSTAVVEAFKAHGARVVQGSPGCVGKVPAWAKTTGTAADLNSNLCTLRNIGIEIAHKENVAFVDVFWPMLTAGDAAHARYGTSYAIAGGDGVHPSWAGHTVMAYAFLKALGLHGDIGTFTVDLDHSRMKVSPGHQIVAQQESEFHIKSARYPFCCCAPEDAPKVPGATAFPSCDADQPDKDNSIRSGLTLVPFNAQLNRLMLVGRNSYGKSYEVTWGGQSKTFTSHQLSNGINLVEEFPENPFCEAFARVDAAIAAKQVFETKQIKERFRSAEAKADMEAVVSETEKERQQLVDAIHAAFTPVTHTIKIVAE